MTRHPMFGEMTVRSASRDRRTFYEVPAMALMISERESWVAFLSHHTPRDNAKQTFSRSEMVGIQPEIGLEVGTAQKTASTTRTASPRVKSRLRP